MELQDSNWSLDSEWLAANRETYAGKWICLKDGRLVGMADTIAELVERFGMKGYFFTRP